MTGHLVLSSLHTNDAATAIPRLLDMKIDPFLIASTVNIVIAQRLLRRICNVCIRTHEITKEEEVMLKYNQKIKKYLEKKGYSMDKLPTLYEGKGCPVCSKTGYHGRVGVFEVLEVDEEIRELILQRAPSNVIEDKAREHGMSTIFEDGVDKVLSGVTTLSEVIRVAGE